MTVQTDIHIHAHLKIGTFTATDRPSKLPLKMSELPPLSNGSASTLNSDERAGEKGGQGEGVRYTNRCMPTTCIHA